MGLAFCLSVTFTPLGCGGTQDTGYRPTLPMPEGPTAPEATVTQLTDCTKQGASRLTGTHYAVLFDVNVTEGGDVGMVEIKDSMIGDRQIESCMVRALEAMPLPMSIMGMLPTQPVSPQSRGYMGNVWLLGGAVNLVPIVIFAAGVTILVAVTLHVADKTIKAIEKNHEERERCKKIKKMCIKQCIDEEIPTGTHDGMPYHKCLRECLEVHGCWGKAN
jgi:hypothetical protein